MDPPACELTYRSFQTCHTMTYLVMITSAWARGSVPYVMVQSKTHEKCEIQITTINNHKTKINAQCDTKFVPCVNSDVMVSHQQVVLQFCELQYPVLLYVLNSHENFFGPTITIHTNTTNEHPFLQRDLILHQSRCFGSSHLTVRSPGLEVDFYVTELRSRAVIRKNALSL